MYGAQAGHVHAGKYGAGRAEEQRFFGVLRPWIALLLKSMAKAAREEPQRPAGKAQTSGPSEQPSPRFCLAGADCALQIVSAAKTPRRALAPPLPESSAAGRGAGGATGGGRAGAAAGGECDGCCREGAACGGQGQLMSSPCNACGQMKHAACVALRGAPAPPEKEAQKAEPLTRACAPAGRLKNTTVPQQQAQMRQSGRGGGQPTNAGAQALPRARRSRAGASGAESLGNSAPRTPLAALPSSGPKSIMQIQG